MAPSTSSPSTWQTALGVSALTTGLLLLPGGIIQGVASPCIGLIFSPFVSTLDRVHVDLV